MIDHNLHDYLKKRDDKKVMKQMKDEELIFSCKTRKESTIFGFWEPRDLVLTSKRLLNLNGSTIKRSIPIEKIETLTYSNLRKEKNFILRIVD